MRIKIIEIEATSEDLRQSNGAAEGIARLMRNAFAGAAESARDYDEDDREDENDEQ